MLNMQGSLCLISPCYLSLLCLTQPWYMVLSLHIPTGLFLLLQGFLCIALAKRSSHAPVLQTLRHLKNTFGCVKNTTVAFLQKMTEVKQLKACTTALGVHERKQKTKFFSSFLHQFSCILYFSL